MRFRPPHSSVCQPRYAFSPRLPRGWCDGALEAVPTSPLDNEATIHHPQWTNPARSHILDIVLLYGGHYAFVLKGLSSSYQHHARDRYKNRNRHQTDLESSFCSFAYTRIAPSHSRRTACSAVARLPGAYYSAVAHVTISFLDNDGNLNQSLKLMCTSRPTLITTFTGIRDPPHWSPRTRNSTYVRFRLVLTTQREQFTQLALRELLQHKHSSWTQVPYLTCHSFELQDDTVAVLCAL